MSVLSRFRFLVPRFSIGNLLMLMVIVGLCLAWYDQRRKLGEQAAAIENQRLEITRLTINNILRSDMTDEDKAKLIGAFVTLGDPVSKIQNWSKHPPSEVAADDAEIYFANFADCDLLVFCRDGRIWSAGYFKKNEDVGHRYFELLGEYVP
jgi:hypothetical protein